MKIREAEQRLQGKSLRRCAIVEQQAGRDVNGTIESAGFDPGSFTIRWWHDGSTRTTTFDDCSWSYEFPDGRTLHVVRVAPDTRDYDMPHRTTDLYVVTLPTS